VTQGRENLQFISELKIQARISEQQADSLFAEHNKILDALIEETKLITQGQGTAEQVIRIEGGLPVMPGHEHVIMPVHNGHAIDGEVMKSIPEQTPQTKDPGP
jgi:hypothetical protein